MNKKNLVLEIFNGRLQLRDHEQTKVKPIYVDFFEPALQRRAENGFGGQFLARAIGVTAKNSPMVLDLTAGLGTDAFLLAAWGCKVVALERSEIIFKLLEDGLKRTVKESEKTTPMSLSFLHTDARDYLKTNTALIDVVYVDPMYPESNKTALPRKEMQILRKFLEPSPEAETIELLELAVGAGGRRVVLKRPPQAAELKIKGRTPSHALSGKSIRYDIYQLR